MVEKAKLLAKDKETLSQDTSPKFNGAVVAQKDDIIMITQEEYCKTLQCVKAMNHTIRGSRGRVRENATPKEQYIAQRARGAYIASLTQPEASYDLSKAAQVTDPSEEDISFLNKGL